LGSQVHQQCMQGIWWTDGHAKVREMALKKSLRCGTWEQSPPPGAGPHQAEHTHRHQTVVFRSEETCPEGGSKCALPSEKPRGPPPENGFPLNNVRVRGQADPYTQRKRDGAPLRNGTTVWSWELGYNPTPCKRGTFPGGNHGEHCGLDREDQPYLRVLDDKFQSGVPPTRPGIIAGSHVSDGPET